MGNDIQVLVLIYAKLCHLIPTLDHMFGIHKEYVCISILILQAGHLFYAKIKVILQTKKSRFIVIGSMNWVKRTFFILIFMLLFYIVLNLKYIFYESSMSIIQNSVIIVLRTVGLIWCGRQQYDAI